MNNGGIMFGIKYETWQNVCKMYFKKKINILQIICKVIHFRKCF